MASLVLRHPNSSIPRKKSSRLLVWLYVVDVLIGLGIPVEYGPDTNETHNYEASTMLIQSKVGRASPNRRLISLNNTDPLQEHSLFLCV